MKNLSKASTIISKINKKRAYILKNKSSSLDFSLSENPLEKIPIGVIVGIIKNINSVNQYPLKAIQSLKKEIANQFKINIKNVGVGAGLEQVIENCFKTIVNPKDEVIIPNPSFYVFGKSAFLVGAKPRFVKPGTNFSLDLSKTAKEISCKAKLIIFSNPNNPTGQVISNKEIISLANEVAPIIVIVDEANIEFGGKSLISEKNLPKNIIILRTFSKAYGLAGLRIGICIGSPRFINAFNQISQSVPVSNLSCAAAIAGLKDKNFIKKTKEFTKKERTKLINAFKRNKIEVFPSQANNILINTDYTKFKKFLDKNNVGFIDASCFRDIPKGCFRVSIRTKEKNKKLVTLLQNYKK
jgi:histidinol-phosphate aminotransferase